MRIIGGTHKGRSIHAPNNLPVRPTTDFAKESLFNILNNEIDFDGVDALDLFCGTGNITYELASRGSLFLTRPSLFNYAAQRSDLEAMAADLFRMVESGKVKIEINQRYALKDAQQAHRDLESRKTTGSTILLP